MCSAAHKQVEGYDVDYICVLIKYVFGGRDPRVFRCISGDMRQRAWTHTHTHACVHATFTFMSARVFLGAGTHTWMFLSLLNIAIIEYVIECLHYY